ncbi:hypothetical protein PoB_001687900 [Plakobranchus ocellatus]|uniref:F-box domain-containing protein n=1 Tax=Plakobranchus ocellatus TaxID=259542 RepID=A0AAV3Z4Z7_9GAST|nr:hypothetical protein PoB_001687900 [Plakobranchus ocellatus]
MSVVCRSWKSHIQPGKQGLELLSLPNTRREQRLRAKLHVCKYDLIASRGHNTRGSNHSSSEWTLSGAAWTKTLMVLRETKCGH